MYDVIIIGAGPTGSTAAKILAEKGKKVLLVEKFKMPRYKSCSGQLIKRSIDLVQTYFGEAVPASVMCTPAKSRGMIFTDDKGKEFCFEQPGLNVWRSSFDDWLVRKAAEKGAELRDGTAAVRCRENNGVVTVTLRGTGICTEEAKYIIDCEGVTGSVKKKILKHTPQYITTFQTFNKGSIHLDYHYFYAYLQPELSEYDAWFNVKDNLLVLGVAVRDAGRIKYFYDRFIDYMKNRHALQIHEQVKAERWLMPCIRPGCPVDYGVGRVLFAGETAGFLNPMGEGISGGMESGYQAACAVSNYFDDPEMVYEEYKKNTGRLKGYMERQWSFAGGMAEKFGEMKL